MSAPLPWDEQDEAVHVGTAHFFGPGYRANLVDGWLPRLPEVHQRLRAGRTVADVGCGDGPTSLLMSPSPWSTGSTRTPA